MFAVCLKSQRTKQGGNYNSNQKLSKKNNENKKHKEKHATRERSSKKNFEHMKQKTK